MKQSSEPRALPESSSHRVRARRSTRPARALFAGVASVIIAVVVAACGSDGGGGPSADAAGGTGALPGAQSGGMGGIIPSTDTACREDGDCMDPANGVCDPKDGCVACLFDWDCASAHRCENKQCIPKTPCSTAEDCGSDEKRPVCDEVLQQCVECRFNEQCGENQRCENSKCVPFEPCVNSRVCSDGKVCDTLVGVCVTCVADGDCGEGSACVDHACVPVCDSDKECLGLGLLCDRSVGRCVECLGHQDCPELYHCGAGGTCEVDVCEVGQSRCESAQALATCREAGDGFVPSTCASGSGCVEDGMQAECEPWLCTPSAIACSDDASGLITCSSDGFEIQETSPCPMGQACEGGSCKDVVCEADSYSCSGRTLSQCNSAGTASAQVRVCNHDEYCNAETGGCDAQLCQPYQAACDASIVKTCDSTGLGWLDDETDCSLTDEVCFGGTCVPKVCESPYLCAGALLYECLDNGSRLNLKASCAAAALCDATAGKCSQPVCMPGEFACDGNVATRCNGDGTGYTNGGTDCSESDLVCHGGGCLPEICEAGTVYCSGGNPQQCGAKGTTTTQSDTCSTGEYCEEGSQFCKLDKCTADQPACDGSIATTCNSDGSGFLTGGTDCTETEQVCEDGSCVDVICTPGERVCQGQGIYKCNSAGTGYALWTSCYSSQFCDDSGDTAVCVADICTPGHVGCDGEFIATCAADGGSWINPGTDCSASDQVCAFGACVAQEIGTQGSNYSSGNVSDATLLTAFTALTTRKLTQLEFHAAVAGTQKLTWVVYKKRSENDTYDLVYQLVQAVSQPSRGWISSGVLGVEIEAGERYAVGVHVDGTVSASYRYTSSSSSFLPSVSFARLPTAVSTEATDQPDVTESLSTYSSYYKYYLRYTVGLPD